MQRNEGRALQPGSSHFRGKKKKEVFLKIILITKCSSSLQNLPIADWLQNTGQTSYLLCKSWALRKQITNWHLSPPKGKQITENKGREALSRTPQAARGGTRRAPAAMLPAPCRAPSPATAVPPPPPPPRTATHLCLPSRSLASAGKLRGSCRKTRSLLTQPEAPSRPPLPAPRWGRRRHSLGAASNHRGKGEGEGGVRRGAAAGAAGAAGEPCYLGGSCPWPSGAAAGASGSAARRAAWRRPHARPARAPPPPPAALGPGLRKESAASARRPPAGHGGWDASGVRARRIASARRGDVTRAVERTAHPRPLCWFLQVMGAGSSAHGRGPERGTSLGDIALLTPTSPQCGLPTPTAVERSS